MIRNAMEWTFKLKPVAQCSHCNKTTHNKTRIDQRCYEQIDRSRCQGTFIAKNENTWALCHPCKGTGAVEKSRRCTNCKGDGWHSFKIG